MKEVSAREVALKTLLTYPGKGQPSDVLEDLLELYHLERRDRALATQIVSGTIKWRRRLDFVIKYFSRKRRVVAAPILNILRLSLYQLMFLDRVPPYSVTDEAVRLAKKYADTVQAGYVNAILRTYLRRKNEIEYPDLKKDPIRHISTVYSHPPWLVSRWLNRYSIDEVVQLAKANNRIPPVGIRINSLRTGVEEVERMLKEDGIEIVSTEELCKNHIYIRGGTPLESNRVHKLGLCQVQDASSTLVGFLANPPCGDVIGDLCSAPGGKVTHLYELAGGKARVVASDINLARLAKVKVNAERLGHRGMLYCVADARKPPFRSFDLVLIDAPCTGLGVLARRWDLRWRKRERDIARMASYQLEIVLAATEIVKRGGVVIYSTCSIEPEENEKVVEAVLARMPQMRLEDISGLVPESVRYKEGMMQTLPHVHGVDGVFGARMKKV